MKINNKINIAILLLILASCSVEKRCARHISKAKEMGCLSEKTDTIWKPVNIPGETITIEIPAEVDSAGLEKLLDSVIQATKDSCLSKKDIMGSLKKIPCKTEPVNYEDSLVKVTAYVENGNQKLKVEIKPQTKLVPHFQEKKIITKTVTVEKIPWWVYLVFCLGVAAILGLIFKRSVQL